MKLKAIHKNGVINFCEATSVTVVCHEVNVRVEGSDLWSLKKGQYDLIELDGEVLHMSEEYLLGIIDEGISAEMKVIKS